MARAGPAAKGTSPASSSGFDDVNYEGTTYNLGFDARRDQLRGLYCQEPTRQQSEVVFVRRR